jgi:hypothetical protein
MDVDKNIFAAAADARTNDAPDQNSNWLNEMEQDLNKALTEVLNTVENTERDPDSDVITDWSNSNDEETEAIQPPTAEEENTTSEEQEVAEDIEICTTTDEEDEAQDAGGLKRQISMVEGDAEERRPIQRLRLEQDSSDSSD